MSGAFGDAVRPPFTPPLSNRGGKHGFFMRDLAQSVHIPPFRSDYATVLAGGWDTWQETWKLRPSDDLARRLDEAQSHAKAFSSDGKGVAQFILNERPMLVRSTGAKGGARWVLEDSEMLIMIRPNNAWGVTVRLLSAGLWGRGLENLRNNALSILSTGGFLEPDDPAEHESPRVSRADYAIDFQCATFVDEFKPDILERIVTHHKKKISYNAKLQPSIETEIEFWLCGGKVETLTIGRMPGLQMQIYNKTKEITDISGKEWMRELWAREGLYDAGAPVYRFEIRFPKDHLKERRATDYATVVENRGELIGEALFKNRLVVPRINDKPTENKDRSKWDFHPLWGMFFALRGKKKCSRWGDAWSDAVSRSPIGWLIRSPGRFVPLLSYKVATFLRRT